MGVTLSIANAPADLVERVRKRAERRDHSIEAELLEIIAEAVSDEDGSHMTPAEIYAELRAKGYSSPAESVAMIREDRDLADGRR